MIENANNMSRETRLALHRLADPPRGLDPLCRGGSPQSLSARGGRLHSLAGLRREQRSRKVKRRQESGFILAGGAQEIGDDTLARLSSEESRLYTAIETLRGIGAAAERRLTCRKSECVHQAFRA